MKVIRQGMNPVAPIGGWSNPGLRASPFLTTQRNGYGASASEFGVDTLVLPCMGVAASDATVEATTGVSGVVTHIQNALIRWLETSGAYSGYGESVDTNHCAGLKVECGDVAMTAWTDRGLEDPEQYDADKATCQDAYENCLETGEFDDPSFWEQITDPFTESTPAPEESVLPAVSGKIDSAWEGVIKMFQTSKGLVDSQGKADGILGPNTLTALLGAASGGLTYAKCNSSGFRSSADDGVVQVGGSWWQKLVYNEWAWYGLAAVVVTTSAVVYIRRRG